MEGQTMSTPLSVDMLRGLVSETRNPNTRDIDRLSTGDLLRRINTEDHRVAEAVAEELPMIATAVDAIVAAFRKGGRLLYLGAGTSGRLGVLDASECPPTFSVPPEMVVGMIAGGDHALRHPVEGAEDSPEAGAGDVARANVSADDVVVGIAVSGRTPYVLGALEAANARGAVTVALTCNPGSAMAEKAQISIAPVVGPEVITGSTRLKSGTAQKMVLNMLTTASMVKLGKTYENLMVDLTVSNAKLQTRATGIVSDITGLSEEEATAALYRAEGRVKEAILMEICGLSLPAASAALAANDGVLRRAIDASS